MRLFIRLTIITFLLVCYTPSKAQTDKQMFKQKRERKRVWRRWRSNREAYNPYLDKKGKKKPSAKIAKGNRKEQRIQRREFKKSLRRGKRTTRKHSKVR